jgi:hypothetical protein
MSWAAEMFTLKIWFIKDMKYCQKYSDICDEGTYLERDVKIFFSALICLLAFKWEDTYLGM